MTQEYEDRSPRWASGAGDRTEPAGESRNEGESRVDHAIEVQCPLCGHRFEPGENPACAHCPKLFATCGMIMCPNCSHEFPR